MPETMNFTQFAGKNGYMNDYGMLDHTDLSPSGRCSRSSREAARARHLDRIRSNEAGHAAFQSAINRGEVVDLNGDYRPTPRGKTPEALRDKRRISGNKSRIQLWERVGVSGKTGKLRPTYRKMIEAARAETRALVAKWDGEEWAVE